jgi:hypothetical protein
MTVRPDLNSKLENCVHEADKGIAVIGEFALRRRTGTAGKVRLLAS